MDKKFWSAVFTLSGTMIGAGILGLPYVFSKPGFLIGLMWLVGLGVILVFTKLCLGEVGLRTKEDHQLTGYAEKYLGIWGKRIMFFAMLFGIYSALIAYLIGEGQSFSMLITGGLDYSIYFGIGFWLVMTLLLHEGLKGLKKIESYGVIIIILIILFMFIWFFEQINPENLLYVDVSHTFLPFGIVLFALLGFSSIPEMRLELGKSKKYFKKAIVLGSLIPIILYAIFSLVFIGVLGREISEVATLSFGGLVSLLGIFTMLTSYFVLSFSLKDMFYLDFHSSRLKNLVFVSLIPLLIYLAVSIFGLLGFVKILGIGGAIAGGLTGILILFMNKEAKERGDRKPEYKMPLSWFFVILLSLIFIFGIIVELFF